MMFSMVTIFAGSQKALSGKLELLCKAQLAKKKDWYRKNRFRTKTEATAWLDNAHQDNSQRSDSKEKGYRTFLAHTVSM